MTDFVPFFLLRSLDQESNNFLAPVLSKDGVVVYASATASSALVHAQWAVWFSRLLLKIISAAKMEVGSPTCLGLMCYSLGLNDGAKL